MKTKIVFRDKSNIVPNSPQAARVYDGSTVRRTPKTAKLVTKSKGKVKQVTYGPYDRFGNRTKTKVKVKPGR